MTEMDRFGARKGALAAVHQVDSVASSGSGIRIVGYLIPHRGFVFNTPYVGNRSGTIIVDV